MFAVHIVVWICGEVMVGEAIDNLHMGGATVLKVGVWRSDDTVAL